MQFAINGSLRANQLIVAVQLNGAVGQVPQALDHADLAVGDGPDAIVETRAVLRLVDQNDLAAADRGLHTVAIADCPEQMMRGGAGD